MIKKAAYFLLFLSTSLHAQNDTHPETPDGEVSIENLWTPVPIFQNAIYLEETEGEGGEDPSSFTSPTHPFPFVVVQSEGDDETEEDLRTPMAAGGEAMAPSLEVARDFRRTYALPIRRQS